jgi:O-methyltransferase involved in polyketide biosynthesis
MDNMTALVSCFARAYHYRNSNLPVFADHVAEKMLTAEEYDAISLNMKQGIQYFAPDFHGTQEEVLQFDAFLKGSGMTAPAGVGYCLAVRKG